MTHFDNFMPIGYQMDTSVLTNIKNMIAQRDGLISSLTGNNVIVSGVVNDGFGTFSDGFIVHNGKPYRFISGLQKAKLKIKRISYTRPDETQEEKPSHYEDVLEFSSETDAEIDFNLLTRYNPYGAIIGEVREYYGDLNAIPAGWRFCDGTNGTPDRRKRVAVGLDTSSSDYDTLRKTGGQEQVTLTIAQMPAHKHTFTSDEDFGGNGDIVGLGGGNSANQTEETSTAGGGEPHENRMPFIVAGYIMWSGV